MNALAANSPTAVAATRKPMLQLRGVETFYGKIQALKGIDLDVNEGEIVTLIGANGAGKSTTMMTIFGTPRARKGTITFAGQEITGLAPHHDRAHVDRAIAGRAAHLSAHDGLRKPADGRLDRRVRAFR